MTCDSCSETTYRAKNVGPSKWVCPSCVGLFEERKDSTGMPHFIQTVNYKNYFKNGGNVSKARVDMIRSRRLSPDDNHTVILTRNGRATDRKASDY